MVISGLFYMYFSVLKNGPEVARLNYIAIIHVTVAFLLLGFVVGHVYLTTTGLKPLSAIKAMLTGWEDMSDEDAKTALEENLKVAVIKERKSILGPENTIQEQLFESTFEEVVQKLGIETESTRLREKLLDSNVGYFRINKEGFYVDVNDNWLKLYRYNSKDEIIGKHYSLSRTKEDFVKLQEMVERVLHGEVIPFAKTRRHCKDGSIGYHNITMTPVIDGEDIVGFEGFITDIPDQKE